MNVDTARLERRAAFLDSVGVKSLTRDSDSSGDAFETLHKDGKALGLPVTLVIDRDGCEVATVEGGAEWDSAEARRWSRRSRAGRGLVIRSSALSNQPQHCSRRGG